MLHVSPTRHRQRYLKRAPLSHGSLIFTHHTFLFHLSSPFTVDALVARPLIRKSRSSAVACQPLLRTYNFTQRRRSTFTLPLISLQALINMLFNAFAKTAILAVALTASTAVAAPVPRDVGNTIEAVSSIPLAGAVMVARGRSSKNPVAAPAPATPAQPPGTVKLVDPASSNNQVSQPAAVEAFLNPTDKKTKNHLNSALDDAAVGRVGTLHSVDKKGNMPAKNELQNTGLRVDGQGGSPEGQKAK